MEEKLKQLHKEMDEILFKDIDFTEKEKNRVRNAVKRAKMNKVTNWFPRIASIVFSICTLLFLSQYISHVVQDQQSDKQESTRRANNSVTQSGGYLDTYTFIRDNMKQEVPSRYPTFTSGNIKLVCIDSNEPAKRCGSPIYYFISPPKSYEEAYQMLADHLPSDSVKISETQLDEDEYVYTLFSKKLRLFGAEFRTDPDKDFHLVFKTGQDGEIFVANIETDLYKYRQKR